MAKINGRRCDICGKYTPKIVTKLYLSPFGEKHSEYTHHADVGECCADRVKEIIRWVPRAKIKQGDKKRVQQNARTIPVKAG